MKRSLTLLAFAALPLAAVQDTLDVDLVLRLFGGGYSAPLTREAIFVNEPPPLLADLPLPPRTQAVGGVAHDRLSALGVLDSQLPPAEVAAFYRRTLEDLGHTTTPSDGYRSMFVEAPPPQHSETYCKDARVVTFIARRADEAAAEITDVRLDIWGERSGDSCELLFGGGGPEPDGPSLTLLPPLANPEGARSLGGGKGGGGSGSFYADQQLETDLSPSDLLQHYREQVEAGGWTPAPLQAEEATLGAFTRTHQGTRYTVVLSVRRMRMGW